MLWQVRLRADTKRNFHLDFAAEWDARAVALFGPSGAGKTTIIESLLGLRRDVRGRIMFSNQVWQDSDTNIYIAPAERRLGWIPQEGALFPHLTVRGNLELAAQRVTGPNEIEHWTNAFEIADLVDAYPGQLSGGQAQRAALARALVSGPQALLLDEPFSSLDRRLRSGIMAEIRGLRDGGMPIVLVSHDPEEVEELADWAIVIGDGRIIDQGLPKDVVRKKIPQTFER